MLPFQRVPTAVAARCSFMPGLLPFGFLMLLSQHTLALEGRALRDHITLCVEAQIQAKVSLQGGCKILRTSAQGWFSENGLLTCLAQLAS